MDVHDSASRVSKDSALRRETKSDPEGVEEGSVPDGSVAEDEDKGAYMGPERRVRRSLKSPIRVSTVPASVAARRATMESSKS